MTGVENKFAELKMERVLQLLKHCKKFQKFLMSKFQIYSFLNIKNQKMHLLMK